MNHFQVGRKEKTRRNSWITNSCCFQRGLIHTWVDLVIATEAEQTMTDRNGNCNYILINRKDHYFFTKLLHSNSIILILIIIDILDLIFQNFLNLFIFFSPRKSNLFYFISFPNSSTSRCDVTVVSQMVTSARVQTIAKSDILNSVHYDIDKFKEIIYF